MTFSTKKNNSDKKRTVEQVIENSLLTLVKSGDRKAFKEMYEKCIGYVYTVVKRYVENPSDHADVIQEIFARLFLNLKTFDSERGDFKPWLRRLTINQCFQHHRQGKSPKFYIQIEETEEQGSNEVEKELTQLTKTEIETLLSEMPEGYRKVFMLIVIDEYAHKEVAELLNISTETSRSQYSRAKSWIRKNVFSNKKKILASEL